MKIFHIVTVSEYGGAQSVIANLLSAFAPDNETFILYGGEGEAWQDLDAKITRLKISKHRKKISLKDIFPLFRLIYYRIKYNPDIIHLHSSKMGILGRIAFSPKKIVLSMHGFDCIRMAHKKFIVVERIFQHRAARIVAVGGHDVNVLKIEGIDKNVDMVYNGIMDYTKINFDEKDFRLVPTIKEIKQKYRSVIMCIARISGQKKFDLFVDIAKIMPDDAFVWIGNKEEMTGLPENIYCLGEASNAHFYLKYADVFILPSNYEGLPISILEALSYSVPAVASDVGAISEVLDGTNGFVVENTPEAFKEKIEYCLQPENHSAMSEAARESYLKDFTIDKMVEGYKRVYNEIYTKNHAR